MERNEYSIVGYPQKRERIKSRDESREEEEEEERYRAFHVVSNFRDVGIYGARGYGALIPRRCISIFIECIPRDAKHRTVLALGPEQPTKVIRLTADSTSRELERTRDSRATINLITILKSREVF